MDSRLYNWLILHPMVTFHTWFDINTRVIEMRMSKRGSPLILSRIIYPDTLFNITDSEELPLEYILNDMYEELKKGAKDDN